MSKEVKFLKDHPDAKQHEVYRVLHYIRGHFKSHIHPLEIRTYKHYLLSNFDRGMKIESFQSNIKSPLIKQSVDSAFASIYDNNIGFRVTPQTKDDYDKTENFKNFLDWAFSKGRSYESLMEAVKESIIIGRGFCKIWYNDGNREVSYQKGKNKKTIKLKGEQFPFIEYVPAFNLYYDTSAKSIYDSHYIIERKVLHKKDILKRYSVYIDNIEDKLKKYQAQPYYFDTDDYSRVKVMSFWDSDFKRDSFLEDLGRTGTFGLSAQADMYTKNFFTINFEGGFSEVIEYWEDDRFILIIDGYIVYDGENPYPNKRKPYVGILYNKIPGSGFSHGIGTALVGEQESIDTMLNLTLDNMKLLVAPMFQKMRGGDIVGTSGNVLSYSPYKVFEVNTDKAISRIDLGIPDFSGINIVDYLYKISDMSEGMNSYANGYQNKVERSAAGVTALIESYKARLLPLMDSINQALTIIAEFWGIIALTLMDDTLAIRKVSEDGEASFIDIPLDEFMGRFDIEIDPRSLKASTKDLRKRQLLDMINIASSTGQDPNTGQFFIDMKELWKELFRVHDIMPDDLIINTDEILESQKEVQEAQAQAQAGMQGQGIPSEEIPQEVIPEQTEPVGEDGQLDYPEYEPTETSDILREAYQS